MLRRLTWALRALWLLAWLPPVSFAQEVDVTFGFEGEVVTDAWNPVRVTLRDAPAAELLLELDRGSLRGGESPLRYRVPLAGGGGRYTFEDVFFIPPWQQFSWSVRTPDRVLASGSLERRRIDPRPLHLVLSRDLGAERGLFGPEARVLEAYGALPERAGAFDGVATLVVGDTLTPPSPQALAAAAAGGSTVLLLEPDPASAPLTTAPYDTLFAAPQQRVGAGWLLRSTREEAAAALAGAPRLDRRELEAALRADDLARPPPHLPPSTPLWAFFGYALGATLLLRFGRVPGLLTALLIASLGGLVGFFALRGEATLQVRARHLSLAGSGLAQRLEQQGIFTPVRRELLYPADHYGAVYPLDPAHNPRQATSQTPPYPTLTSEGLALTLSRHTGLHLSRRPELEDARFYWREGALVNAGGARLGDVFILGRGRQPPLEADSSVTPELGDSLPPEPYTPLLPHLPRGSALAAAGDTVFVALPERAP